MKKRSSKSYERLNDIVDDCPNLLHIDVVGPMNMKSYHEKEYLVSFIDTCSKFSCIYMLSNMLHILEKFKIFPKAAVRVIGTNIINVRFDHKSDLPYEVLGEYLSRRTFMLMLQVLTLLITREWLRLETLSSLRWSSSCSNTLPCLYPSRSLLCKQLHVSPI